MNHLELNKLFIPSVIAGLFAWFFSESIVLAGQVFMAVTIGNYLADYLMNRKSRPQQRARLSSVKRKR